MSEKKEKNSNKGCETESNAIRNISFHYHNKYIKGTKQCLYI